MNSTIKIENEGFGYVAFFASVFFHVLLFIAAALVVRFSQQISASGGEYVQITTSIKSNSSVNEQPVQKDPGATKPVLDEEEAPALTEKPVNKKDEVIENNAAPVTSAAPAKISFNSSNTDTSSLNNIYAESTLDVRIKYPAGWTYIDQNVKNKLDGVTFIATQSSYNPPPYVHLSVMDKYLFNESRYKYKIETYGYTAYYNDPEELAGQVEQVFYLRTETDEDYTIKFIMKGKENFNALQPVFFGMVKTFKFGDSLF